MKEFDNIKLVHRIIKFAEQTDTPITISEYNVYSTFQCDIDEFSRAFNALHRAGLLLPREPDCYIISGVTLLGTLLFSPKDPENE